MTEYDRQRNQANTLKAMYPPGTRILLIEMGDDPRPIPSNTRGTVVAVDDIGTVHCSFDNGRQLGMVYGEDSFRRLTQDEIAEENNNTALEDAVNAYEGPSM